MRRLQWLQLVLLVVVLSAAIVIAVVIGRMQLDASDRQLKASDDLRAVTELRTTIMTTELMVRRAQSGSAPLDVPEYLGMYERFRSAARRLDDARAGGQSSEAVRAREEVRQVLVAADRVVAEELRAAGAGIDVDRVIRRTTRAARGLTGSLARWHEAAAAESLRMTEESRRLSRILLITRVALNLLLMAVAVISWWLIDRARGTLSATITASEERFRSLVQNSTDVVLLVGAGGVVRYASPGVTRLLGRQPDEIEGRPVVDLMGADSLDAITSATDAGGPVPPVLWRAQRADGTTAHLESVVSDRREDPAVAGLVLNTRDVTDRHEMEVALEHRANHDVLTNLANRDLFGHHVNRALATLRGRPGICAVILIDLDDFKTVNDSLGHSSGDTLLVEVSRRIAGTLDSDAIAARLGGDEFVVLVPAAASTTQVEGLARRIVEMIARPLIVEGHELVVQACAGISVVDGSGGHTAIDLIREADLAMYAAKRRGRGKVVVYDPTMGEGARKRLRLMGDLNRAVERDQLSVAHQPIVDLATNRICGFEALMRWTHPEQGPIPPPTFIRLAEETGQIRDLGRWILSRAAQEVLEITDGRDDDLFLAVNVSTRELESADYTARVAASLAETGFPAERLIVEVTETTLMRDPATLQRHLEALKALGVDIAVDDFGTGYSSLAYLARLPIDIVKIDRAFVTSLAEGGRERRIADMIMGIGEILGLRSLAEGIELPLQLDAVRRLGCEMGQGYLLGRPMPASDAGALIARESSPGVPTAPRQV